MALHAKLRSLPNCPFVETFCGMYFMIQCMVFLCYLQSASGIKIKNISFKNIWGTSASKVAVKFLCSSKVPCQEVKLSNINIKYNGPGGPALSSCSYVNGLSSGLQVPSSCLWVMSLLGFFFLYTGFIYIKTGMQSVSFSSFLAFFFNYYFYYLPSF